MRHTPPTDANLPSGSAFRRRPKSRRFSRWVLCSLIAAGSGLIGGCGSLARKYIKPGKHDTQTSYHDGHGLQIEYPDVRRCEVTQPAQAAASTTMPLALQDPAELPTFDLSLEEAIFMAVEQSPVLRTIGGTVVTAPQGTATKYDPALTASGLLGSEAALAAFDAQYTQQLFWDSVDQPNNVALNAITSQFQNAALNGLTSTFNNELAKQTAQGSRFALRHVVNYSRLNVPNRGFRSAFDGWIEAEWRQPLLQGAGTTYNRIAGPTNVPGQYNGVLIARVNEDVALADFEASMVQLVSDVEQAYWDLMVAYRVLDAQIKGREAAQQTFQFQQVRLEVGSGRSDEEAQARSQFYQFQAQVESALGGGQGLYALEQRLRYLIGMPATDGRLIRPTTAPTDVKVVFDWQSALGQALERRVEIRRQKLAIKRREMELTAARLNTRPRLDFLAQYRWRGLGDNLIGTSAGGPLKVVDGATLVPPVAGPIEVADDESSLYGTILRGNFQEARAGFELNFPVGFRAASLAVANARLNLTRERAVMDETELRVSHDLSNAARQVELTHRLLETNYNRLLADIRQVDVLGRRYRDGSDNINFLLQAQRQAVVSAVEFYIALGNYNLAIRDLHRQKGSLLAYNQVQLAEGPWAAGAQQDAHRIGRFLHPRVSNENVDAPAPLTTGFFDPSAVQSSVIPSQVVQPQQPTPSPEGEAKPSGDDAEAESPGEGDDDSEELPAPSAEIETLLDRPRRPFDAPVSIAPTQPDFSNAFDDGGLISVGPSWKP